MLRLFWLIVRWIANLWPRLRRLPRKAAMALGAPGPDQPSRPERLWRAILVVLPLALFAALVMPQVTLVMSPSIEAYAVRSEEHTSELQSLMRISYAVFCLKKNIKSHHPQESTPIVYIPVLT